MAHLTKRKERVDHVVAVRPLAHPLHVMFSLPVDQSMMVTEVIVPPVEYVDKGETVLISVGDSSRGAKIERQVRIPLTIMLRCSRHRSKCWSEFHDRFWRDRTMAEELLSFAPGRLGFVLAKPIPIAPRKLVMVESSEGSPITVWLRGLISRDL